MKKTDFLESIKHYPDDVEVFIEGSSSFIVVESLGEGEKFINLIKQ